MTHRAHRAGTAALLLLFAPAPLVRAAQDPASVQAPASAQSYADAQNRFGFTAPPGWFRLADEDPNEATFQNAAGDNIRATITPLRVAQKAFLDTYVETYLDVLSQTFSDVKFIGQRTTVLAGREAYEYSYSGMYKTTPVICRQAVVFGAEHVLYITYAGFGPSRNTTEQLFTIALSSLWVSPTFGGKPVATTSGEGAQFPFVFRLPQDWIEYHAPGPDTRVFRPGNAREMSALITTFVTKPAEGQPVTVSDEFARAYATRVCTYYLPAPCQIAASSRTTLGGEPAIRFDYSFASDSNIRRVALVLAMHNGRLVGVACEAAQAAYNGYDSDFQAVFTSFKFQ